jgi:acetyltransferase-like isoleucine patch superfamily enzyme
VSRISPSAVIEAGADIGAGCTIWDLSQIRAGASLGPRCTIGRNVFIDTGVVVGARCKVQNNALLYAPARLGDGVFIGPGVILTNDRHPRAVSPAGEMLAPGDWAGLAVEIEDGAAVGAGAVVVAGVTLGAWSLVGAGAVVTVDVLSFALVVGNPARRVGWVGRAGARLEPSGADTLRCPITGAAFADHGDHIEEIP